ncbi:MAG: hypothetical protein AAGD14_18315 [Planctomycetota bacterium]
MRLLTGLVLLLAACKGTPDPSATVDVSTTPTENEKLRFAVLLAQQEQRLALAQTTNETFSLEDWVRTVEHSASGRNWAVLQTASRLYRHPDEETEIVVVGMAHVADPRYFDAQSRMLAGADLVFAEGIQSGEDDAGDADAFLRSDMDPLSRYRLELSSFLGLAVDGVWKRVAKDERWRTVDVSVDQLRAWRPDDDVSMPEWVHREHDRFARLNARRDRGELAPAEFAHLRNLECFRRIKAIDRGSRSRRSSSSWYADPRRDRFVFEELKRVVESESPRRIALIYGAFHAVRLGNWLTEESGYQASAPIWTDAMRATAVPLD